MEIWKTIPSWFKLSNYDDCKNFSSLEWANELSMRTYHHLWFTNPECFNYDATTATNNFFDHIRNNGLVSKQKRDSYPELDDFFSKHEGTYQDKTVAVKNISERNAYVFLLESDKKEEIERDYSILREIADSQLGLMHRLEERKALWRKYSHPIAALNEYGNYAFLEVNLSASNEQILSEFKDWLNLTRGCSEEFVKRKFSKTDFEDWHTSRILPYWDLTSIAALENATIPFHILGEALFPDEFGIDLTERVRKVTKKKSQFLFSGAVENALSTQAESEKMQRNTS